MVFDGLTSTFDGDHMVVQASRVARELEISRESQDAWAARSQSRAAAAQDAGILAEEIVAGRRCRRGRGNPSRHDRREACDAEAGLRSGRDDDGGQRPGGERRCLVRRRVLRGIRALPRPRRARHDRRVRRDRRRLRLPRPDAGESRRARARAGRPHDRRRLPRRDQRGIRLGREQLDAHARSRRGDRQRQRRCDRPRAPDRRLGRPHRGNARATSSGAPAAGSAWQRSARAAGRATPCWSKSDSRSRSSCVLAALAFSGAAQAYTCPATPIETRIESAGAVFVGRSTGFTPDRRCRRPAARSTTSRSTRR